jgi:formate hydrogenlyase subunit 3/multisubunit Na+/H+ antiporter MnhD subunit
MLMLLLTAVIGVATTSYAHGYFQPAQDDRQESEAWHQYTYFWPLWLFLWAALNALFLSGDLFNLYVTLELMGFAAVSLTALVRSPAVLRAAMRYLLVSLSGSLMYLMGVVFLYAGYGVLDIAQLSAAVSGNPGDPSLVAAAALITVGLVMKTALFPFHFWLPPAHANAAAPVSALLSALVVKGSFYILLRSWIMVFHPLADSYIPVGLMLLGVAAILWGSFQAMRQPKLKMLVAYSTVAQLGYLFLLMPILLRPGGGQREALGGIVLFLIAHALAKAAAFLSAGNILYATGDDKLESLDGLTRYIPMTLAAFGVAGVSLTALPPSGGFLAKWMMLNTAAAHDYWLLALIIVAGGLMAAVYIMRVISHLFRQPDPETEKEKEENTRFTPFCMTWPPFLLAVLALLMVFSGVFLLDTLAVGAPWLPGVTP